MTWDPSARRTPTACLMLLCCLTLGACAASKSPDGGGTGGDANASGPSTAAFPLLTPPVVAAAPAALQASAAQHKARRALAANGNAGLQADDIKQRFFESGPSDLFFILSTVDQALASLNGQVAGSPNAACLSNAPTPYTIHPFDQNVQMMAQCSVERTLAGGKELLQWGAADGNFYLWSAAGAAWVAAIATPLSPVAAATLASDANAHYRVEAWFGVGLNNGTSCPNGSAWDRCSYGLIHLVANPFSQQFELTAAGIGLGYCGVQLASDGTNVLGSGSQDMGTSCVDGGSLCVKATDFSQPGQCGDLAFALPAAGRAASPQSAGGAWGVSTYPASSAGLYTFDGSASDALHCGPATATPGVAAFAAGAPPEPGA